MITCGVYKITNTVNGKIYVGSSTNLERRRFDHYFRLRSNKNNHPIQSDFNKYGESNLIFEILEECGHDKLRSLEGSYIRLLNTTDKNYGYNTMINNGKYSNVSAKEIKPIVIKPPFELLTPKELCVMANITKDILRIWLKKGLPSIKIGSPRGIRRFRKDDLEKWINGGGTND